AGLDYAAVGPEHAWLKDLGRAEYSWIGDEDALAAFQQLPRTEGIIPALESSHPTASAPSHAIAYAATLAQTLGPDAHILINLSGRGDKDVQSVSQYLEMKAGAEVGV